MNDFNKILSGTFGPLEKKGIIFTTGIEERMNSSFDYIKTKYKNFNLLNLSNDFIENDLSEAVKSDFRQLETVGYFPVTETEMELDHSIKHALIGSYKAAFADLRRALELSLVSVYLTSETYNTKKAVDWVMSNSNTPNFSESISKLIKGGRYKEFNDKFGWKENLQKLYWRLSDFGHVKGQLKSYRELSKTIGFIEGTSTLSINYETIETFCDLYIETVGEIVVMLALYNPMILVGVPLDEKFGLNGFASGFFYDGQAELVHKLIPNTYREYFKELAEKDIEIRGVVDYFNSLPDLTEKEIKEQIKTQNEFLDGMKTPNN